MNKDFEILMSWKLYFTTNFRHDVTNKNQRTASSELDSKKRVDAGQRRQKRYLDL